jgi:sugar lactone lactonase YvrE
VAAVCLSPEECRESFRWHRCRSGTHGPNDDRRWAVNDTPEGFPMRVIASMSVAVSVLLCAAGGMEAQYFNGPESVTYDARNGRYLVSNVGTGDIVQITDEGDTSYFDRSLTRTLGMTIVDDMLFVADIGGLAKFDLTTGEKIATIYIAGMNELNDVTADTSGYLYITDSSAGRIFRLRISDSSYETIASGLAVPNGILFDAPNNRVLFCQFVYNAPIKEIDLDDLSITTVLSSSFRNFDGLAMDGAGNIYVSCWGTNAVYRYDNDFSQPAEMVSSGHSGPADIFFNQEESVLAVPNYYANVVDFLPITPMGVDGETPGRIPRAFALSQNYPNPFNPTTTIAFDIPGAPGTAERVELNVTDIRGRRVMRLVDAEYEPGSHRVIWNGRDEEGRRVPSGIYFYTLRSGGRVTTKKMVLLK